MIDLIKKSILREEISTRGGGVEIDLTDFGFQGEKMAAYQNYLGGGMLGCVCVNDTLRQPSRPFLDEESNAKLDAIGEELKKYYHGRTNPDSTSYKQNQEMPASAY